MDNRTMKDMNEQYNDCPTEERTYEIDGCKYVVHRHFVGEKNVNEVIGRLALETALNDNLVTV